MAKKTEPKIKSEGRRLPGWALWASVGAIVVIAGVVFFLSRLSQNASRVPTPTASLPTQISVQDAYYLFGSNSAHFLDVRPAADWKAYHIDKSASIPSTELSGRTGELVQTWTIVIIDQDGGASSQQALSILKSAGFTSIMSVAGGMDAWVQARYPLIGTAPY